jgi:hypothetical protein
MLQSGKLCFMTGGALKDPWVAMGSSCTAPLDSMRLSRAVASFFRGNIAREVYNNFDGMTLTGHGTMDFVIESIPSYF